jgi:methyltransferase family protein
VVSNSPAWAGPLPVDDPSPIVELRHVLVEAGFDGPTVRDALGAEGQMLARPGETPVLRRRLAGIEPLGTIATLFVLGSAVPEAAARRAFAPLALERVERLGLVVSAGGLVTPRVRLVPHDDVLIVSDIPDQAEDQHDHVAGIHNPSVTLAHLTIRRPVETALDLGTGSGIQAILAARHSARVVATDLSERALNFATFNALLNGAEGIEFRAGSFFAPVDGERFGLLTCNPPYVISPETAYLFRDSGLAGDTVSQELVRDAPAVLSDGGFGSMLVSWIQPPGEDWSQPLRRWLEGSGCDAILLNYGTQDPLTHASNWTRDRYANDADGFEEVLARWLEYLAGLGAEGIGYGAAVLRRRESGANWVRAYDLPPAGLRRSSDHLLRMFDAVDFLSGVAGDAALLAERFALTECAEVEQRVSLRSGVWSIERIEVRLDDGLRFRAGIDPLIAHLLAGLDGRRTLAEVADELAATQNLDRASLAERAVPVAREMFELGFLERGTDRHLAS